MDPRSDRVALPIVRDSEEGFLARMRRLEAERRERAPQWIERAREGNGLSKDLTGRGAA